VNMLTGSGYFALNGAAFCAGMIDNVGCVVTFAFDALSATQYPLAGVLGYVSDGSGLLESSPTTDFLEGR
jgi:hypothetical protein